MYSYYCILPVSIVIVSSHDQCISLSPPVLVSMHLSISAVSLHACNHVLNCPLNTLSQGCALIGFVNALQCPVGTIKDKANACIASSISAYLPGCLHIASYIAIYLADICDISEVHACIITAIAMYAVCTSMALVCSLEIT